MAIGLFLDVDKVLTTHPVQMQFANMLGIGEELENIEQGFKVGKATSEDFAATLVPLFRRNNFTKEFVESNLANIEWQPLARDLLKLAAEVDTYLVSSGPSYFVRHIAKEWNIPKDRVLCSDYVFSDDGLIEKCTNPITPRGKVDFVQRESKKYDVSIGVGDDVELDAFIHNCTIPILTTEHTDYLSAQRLETVILLVRQLAPLFPAARKTIPDVFIGSSKEGLKVAEAVQLLLQHDAGPQVWPQGVFSAGERTIDDLLKAVRSNDFAVMVLTPDDVVIKRGERKPAARDNVIFELGLFMGRLGTSRTFILHPREQKPDLPTDLLGIATLQYRGDEANLEKAVGPACAQLKKTIQTLGIAAP